MNRIVIALVAVLAAACAKNVKQDAHTGPDGKYKGARTIKLVDNKGSASGIVTYPGGDRIDWKLVEIPKDKRGTLDIELSWKAPRPGLDLAFDVYDEWGARIGKVSPKKPGKATRRKKNTTVGAFDDPETRPVKGKVYIAVYASNRGDAGKYKLDVAFTEEVIDTPITFDVEGLPVPPPPRLAAVPVDGPPPPPPPPPPDCVVWDATNPSCPKDPPCNEKKPDRANPNCPTEVFPECTGPDPANPNCDDWSMIASINSIEPSAKLTTIRINRGAKDGVTTKWTGDVVDASGNKLPGGNFTVYKVNNDHCYGKVNLKKSKLDRNKTVELHPPEPVTPRPD